MLMLSTPRPYSSSHHFSKKTHQTLHKKTYSFYPKGLNVFFWISNSPHSLIDSLLILLVLLDLCYYPLPLYSGLAPVWFEAWLRLPPASLTISNPPTVFTSSLPQLRDCSCCSWKNTSPGLTKLSSLSFLYAVSLYVWSFTRYFSKYLA